MNRTRNARRAQEGFTLIELLVVVAIIGTLATIVGLRLGRAADRADVIAAKAQINSFKTALWDYRLENKRFPTTQEGLEILAGEILDSDKVPLDPWGNPYQYTSPGSNGRDFEIVSLGKNGLPGGEKYEADIESWNLQD